MTDLTPRPIDTDEFPAFLSCAQEAMGREPRTGGPEEAVFEPDRSLAALDGGRVVGTTAVYSRTMTVPGDVELPVAAVRMVSVAPTHRRRGLLTTLMRRQLTDLHEQAREPVAALWASEGAIYGRFGYGVACQHADLRGSTRAAWLRPDVPTGDGRVVLGSLDEVRGQLAAVHDRVRRRTPGWLDRRGGWWDHRLRDPEDMRAGATAYRVARYEAAGGEVDGYAVYRVRADHGDDHVLRATALVHELTAGTPQSYAALWRFVLDLDLVHTVRKAIVPVDEPLAQMLIEPRAIELRVSDGMQVRVVDVDRGLAARRYAAEVDVVLDVTDPFCPWNAGRWRLAGGPGGATCARTGDPADLAVGVEALGAAYLGGMSLSMLAATGRVQQLRPGALAAAARAFAGDRAPWCPEIF